MPKTLRQHAPFILSLCMLTPLVACGTSSSAPSPDTPGSGTPAAGEEATGPSDEPGDDGTPDVEAGHCEANLQFSAATVDFSGESSDPPVAPSCNVRVGRSATETSLVLSIGDLVSLPSREIELRVLLPEGYAAGTEVSFILPNTAAPQGWSTARYHESKDGTVVSSWTNAASGTLTLERVGESTLTFSLRGVELVPATQGDTAVGGVTLSGEVTASLR